MTLKAFNLAILIGWLLVAVGGCLFDIAFGLLLAGLLLIGLTLIVARLGGVYKPAPVQPEEEGN